MSNSNDGNQSQMPGTLKLTKREATLLVHVEEHFPSDFCEHELAASLGWSLDEVREALAVCAAFGLVSTPPGVDVPVVEPVDGTPLVGIDHLLDPEEREKARISHCPRREPHCPLPDADFWFTPEEQAAIGQALNIGNGGAMLGEGFEVALNWASETQARWTLLQMVLEGQATILGPDAHGNLSFEVPADDSSMIVDATLEARLVRKFEN